MTIDAPPAPAPGPPTAPPVALRVVTTYGAATRRFDIAVGGAESVVVEDGAVRAFPTPRLWPVLRDLLPPVDLLRARPAGRPAPAPRAPGPAFAEECVAHVSVATLVEPVDPDATTVPPLVVRTWLVDADTLWSAEQRADGSTDVRPAAAGALADLVVWDVTAALELLARRAAAGTAGTARDEDGQP